jgi:tRNA dimethylallyltransferase
LGLDPALPIMTTLGLRPLLRHLDGELSRAEAIAAGQAETRQYAKRQATWAAGNMIAWTSIDTQQTERTTAEIVSFVRLSH